MSIELDQLSADMPIVYGGNRVTHVPEELAAAFAPGDRLVVVPDDGTLLHIPAAVWSVASDAVGQAAAAFAAMGTVTDDQISAFFAAFADRLEDPDAFAPIAAANDADVATARAKGRSTTRLVLSDKMRADMVSGLRGWRDTPTTRGRVLEQVDHPGWSVELRAAGLGVVGFVFEGRPNVFADACGVLRSGNTVVFRIGSDALGTAQAIVEHALDPAIAAAGLPPGAATLVASAERSAGWAMFADPLLALAVARGSGPAVAQLGAVARQAGTPVSLHGTGGAWLVAASSADAEAFRSAVLHSLDRKVCNTLNVCCVVAERADELVPAFLEALAEAGRRRGTEPKLHVVAADAGRIPPEWFGDAGITRADGVITEARVELIELADLATEWEWEESPEVSLVVVDHVAAAVELCNRWSPRFVASLIADDADEHRLFYETIDAPFVGNGFTRWVDGQYALDRPELGLSNWQAGRLFGRGGVLSGDSVFTVRTVVTQTDPDLRR
jgi:glutamate-5-semialdehyde dehydrogenase